MKQRVIILMGILLLVAAGALVWWWRMRPPTEKPAPSGPLAAEDARRLLLRKNAGIGFVENGRYDKAPAAFQEIRDKLPAEPLGHRNLAVARLLQIRQLSVEDVRNDPARVAELRQQAEEAVDAAIEAEPRSPVPHVLKARLYGHLADILPQSERLRRRQTAALEQAVELNPEAAHIWYQLYDVRRLQRDEGKREAAGRALKRAYERAPRNLAVLQEWLRFQAAANDSDVVSTLQQAEAVLRPIAARLKQENSRYDLLQMQREAIAGIQQNDPQGWGTVIALANILNARHATKLDRRELQPHELEFVLTDFSDDFDKRAQLPRGKLPPGIPVRFTPAAGPQQLPPLKDVRFVRLVDFDLDGRTDVVALQDDRVTAYGRPGEAARWQSLVETRVPSGSRGVLTADLDFDVVAPQQAGKVDARRSPKRRATKTQQNVDRNRPVAAPKPKRRRAANTTPPHSNVGTADVDCIVWGESGVQVLRNEIDSETGQRRLTAVPQSKTFQQLNHVKAATVADFDHDSDLDLIIATRAGITLWSNRGDATFDDVTEFSTLPNPEFQPTVLVPIDFNRDVLIDVVLGSPQSPEAGYLQNVGHGQFRFKPFDPGFRAMGHATALHPIEADGNVSWDWIAAGKQGITLTRTRTVDHGRYRFLDSTTVSKTPVSGARLFDYDNDGYQDVLAWSGKGFHVFRGGPGGAFREVAELVENGGGALRSEPERRRRSAPRKDDFKKRGLPLHGTLPLPDGSAADIADVDGDGDEDVVAVVSNRLTLFVNEGGNANNWIDVELHAQSQDVKNREQRCNIHGIGSLLELKAGATYQPRVVNRPVTHFGLGQRKQADVIRVLWTNGIPQNVLQPNTRQVIRSRQKLLKGSCPYLYTFNGERYVFHTDLLWSSPIGLQVADGVLAPGREWEYLKIPAEKLAPVDGEYRLQITEELWEAGYFDSVTLYAVDHPADVEVFTNEKVGPAAIAQPTVHTVRRPRLPVLTRDQTGRNVLPLLRKRDGRYLQAYDGRLAQGLTREHYVELDLGELNDPRKITLFLTGWVFPTDTSINVFLSHYPGLPAPQPPSVWVRDADGQWKPVIPYMGFPGGKTKTIAVDLSDAFLTDDYRLRIKTTMELRWDAVFFTVDERPAEFRMTRVPLNSARLYFRGFSKRIERPHHAPETYDFHAVDRAPHWPPMLGRFTRYGDVTDLLRRDDDRLVVLGAGDAVELRFGTNPDLRSEQRLDPLPPGWTRDFIIRNVGWDKDADLNTVLGQTVEPLPFRGMPRYPPPPDASPMNTPAYRGYLRTYQRRQQPAARFWKWIRNTPPRRHASPTGWSTP